MGIKEILMLASIVFKDYESSLILFRMYIHSQEYNKARMLTEAMVLQKPTNENVLYLDAWVTEKCEEYA